MPGWVNGKEFLFGHGGLLAIAAITPFPNFATLESQHSVPQDSSFMTELHQCFFRHWWTFAMFCICMQWLSLFLGSEQTTKVTTPQVDVPLFINTEIFLALVLMGVAGSRL
jgi:hypothetical protein